MPSSGSTDLARRAPERAEAIRDGDALKIAFFVSTFPSLSQTFILRQITGLIDRGHAVDIYALGPGQEGKTHPEVAAYKLRARTSYAEIPPRWSQRLVGSLRLIANHPLKGLRALNLLRYGGNAASLRLLHQAAPLWPSRFYDILHAHFGPNGIRTAMLRDVGALAGRLVTSFHGYDATHVSGKRGANLYRFLFRHGDLCTANTVFTAGKLIKLGCPTEKIVALPVGLAPALYPMRARKLEVGETLKILTVARLIEEKGVEYGLRAIERLHYKHHNIRYLIAGEGPLRTSLQALARKLGIDSIVEFVGWKDTDQLRALYSECHLFMLPSVTASDGQEEGQGLVLQEAQATGMPVVSTLQGGIPDGVVDAESGFLVPEKDAGALADRLSYLIDNSHLWPSMGRAGRRLVEDDFDIDKLNDRLVELYRRAILNPS